MHIQIWKVFVPITLAVIGYALFLYWRRIRQSEPYPNPRVRVTRDETIRVIATVTGLHFFVALAVFLYQWKTSGTPLLVYLFHMTRWDADHFMAIAREGYLREGEWAARIAFLPLFPTLIALTAKVTFLREEFAGLLLNLILTGLMSRSFYKLARLDYSPSVSFWAVVIFAVFPTSFVQIVPYTEPLYLWLVFEAFHAARTDQWAKMGITAFFAALTRSNGWFLFPALCFEAYRRGKKDWRVFWVLGVPLAFFVYLGINYYLYGDPIQFTYFQRVKWYKSFSPVWVGLAQAYRIYDVVDFYSFMTGRFAEAFACFVGTCLLIPVVKTQRFSYAVYALFSAWYFISTTFILSTPRYFSSVFPFALLVAPGLEKIGHFRWLVFAVSLSWMALNLHWFTIARWVF